MNMMFLDFIFAVPTISASGTLGSASEMETSNTKHLQMDLPPNMKTNGKKYVKLTCAF